MRLIKNKVFILMMVALVLLIVMGLSAKKDSKLHYIGDAISVPLAPVQNFFSFLGDKVEGSLTYFKDSKELKKENDALKVKVDNLEAENRKLLRYEEENKTLRDALNLKDQFKDYEYVGGNVIAKDLGNWFNIFNIDRGGNDGITVDSPVITSKGLVGAVTEVQPFTSKILSIIDVDSTVSAIITKSMDVVKVSGDMNLKNQGLCRMDYIPLGLDLEVGDQVETSGVGGIYPRGILIGKVKQVIQANNELNRYAIIEPAVDFKRLQEVFVLKSKNNNTGTDNTKK